jgi:anti-sigma-K factor RskA
MSEQSERMERVGNFVLGLMDEAERRAAEAAMRTDPEFRQAVEAFSRSMSPLDLAAAPDPVPAGMWDKVAAATAGLAQDTVAQPAATVVPITNTAPRPRQRWQGLPLAASLLVGVGLGYFGGWLSASPPQPVVIVVLETSENLPGAVFEAFADNSVRIVPLEDFVVPEGQVLQVWTLYDPEVGPISLGTLPRAEVSVLEGRPLPRPVAEQLYEITLEPAPGSPTGRPTGPILVKGLARRLPG